MEMQELEAIGHAAALEFLEAAKHFAHRQPELRAIAPRRLPAPRAASGQFHAHADLRADADLLGIFEDQPQLGILLNDRDDLAADLVGEHRRFDELGLDTDCHEAISSTINANSERGMSPKRRSACLSRSLRLSIVLGLTSGA